MAFTIKAILLAFVMLLSIEVCCAGVKDAAVGGITDDVQTKGVTESHHFWRLRRERPENANNKRKHFGHKIHIEINVPKDSTILDQVQQWQNKAEKKAWLVNWQKKTLNEKLKVLETMKGKTKNFSSSQRSRMIDSIKKMMNMTKDHRLAIRAERKDKREEWKKMTTDERLKVIEAIKERMKNEGGP